MYLREAMGPFAQGPVALIARHGDECVFSADALGLRPLWRLETRDDYIFSSEPGVVSVDEMVSEPMPLGPGEKFMVSIDRRQARARGSASTPRCSARSRDRWLARTGAERRGPVRPRAAHRRPARGRRDPRLHAPPGRRSRSRSPTGVLAGFGWQRDDVKLVQQMASNGAEPIGSLGYDGPLAALSPERQNLADYFKETVAVVTNPAIDREREMEHFSTRAVFGRRPVAPRPGGRHRHGRDLVPGHPRRPPRAGAALRLDLPARSPATTRPACSRTSGSEFRGRAAAIDIALLESETHRGGDRAAQAGGGAGGPRRRRAARAHRPDRLRRRAPLPRPAPGALGGRPGAEALPGRAGEREPAPALLDRAALGRDPQRPRRRPRARARAPTASART